MRHLSTFSFAITILLAVFAAAVTTNRQLQFKQLTQLLNSDSATDNLAAIKLSENYSFNQLRTSLLPILSKQNDASLAAQSLLVKSAFKEDRIHDLDPRAIEDDLYDSAVWWASRDQLLPQKNNAQVYQQIAVDATASPWIRRLAALRCETITNSTIEDLISMAPHDRDGSVLLTVLAIERHMHKKMVSPLIERWAGSYDLELQSASVLLAACTQHPIPAIRTSNESLATISTICSEKQLTLAWRSLHRQDGTINPDVALAGLIIDLDRFLPILIDSARAGLWSHPDHPVELARRFAPQVSTLLPNSLLDQEESRDKWWSLFACGLLQEQR